MTDDWVRIPPLTLNEALPLLVIDPAKCSCDSMLYAFSSDEGVPIQKAQDIPVQNQSTLAVGAQELKDFVFSDVEDRAVGGDKLAKAGAVEIEEFGDDLLKFVRVALPKGVPKHQDVTADNFLVPVWAALKVIDRYAPAKRSILEKYVLSSSGLEIGSEGPPSWLRFAMLLALIFTLVCWLGVFYLMLLAFAADNDGMIDSESLSGRAVYMINSVVKTVMGTGVGGEDDSGEGQCVSAY